MSSKFIRAVNPPQFCFNSSNGSYYTWYVVCLYYDISNDSLMFSNTGRGMFKNGVIKYYPYNSNNITNTLNYSYYNGFGISITNPTTLSLSNKSVFVDNSNNYLGTSLSNTFPVSTGNLIITGCAIYGDTFYVIGSYTNTPNTLIVMDTSLSTINPNNPFNTTTPTFKQTYQTFTAASRICGVYNNELYTVYSGMCTFDSKGNLYITSYGSGVYKYPVGSSFASDPSIFISSTNIYSAILYNPVFDVLYIHRVNNTSDTKNLTMDVYSGNGELIKLGYITGLKLSQPGAYTYNPSQMCIDPYGTLYYEATQLVVWKIEKIVCFKKDTQILTFQGYKRIQDLNPSDLVKTLKHEYVPIYKIGFSEIDHPCNLEERTKDQLYKCSPDKYPEVFEDLVLTGCHSILVDAIESEEQMEKMIEINGRVCETDGKYRLPVCLDEKATVYDVPGNHTIYHLALENDDYYMNYGIYANGLLVESTSKRFMDTIKMTLVE